MKKNKLMLIVLLSLVLVFAGITSLAQEKIADIRISTGSVGAGWYTTCALIADEVNQRVEGFPVAAFPGSGGVGNPMRIQNKD